MNFFSSKFVKISKFIRFLSSILHFVHLLVLLRLVIRLVPLNEIFNSFLDFIDRFLDLRLDKSHLDLLIFAFSSQFPKIPRKVTGTGKALQG